MYQHLFFGSNHLLSCCEWTASSWKSPLSGWDLKSVLASGSKYHVPVNDLYGAMYFHIRDLLIKFHRSIRKHSIDVFVTNSNYVEFKQPTVFSTTIGEADPGPGLLFDRIENCDMTYKWPGIDKFLSVGPWVNSSNLTIPMLLWSCC